MTAFRSSVTFGGDILPCYHPMLLKYCGLNDNGKPNYKFIGTQGYHERYFEKFDPRDKIVPCRKCIGCRLAFSKRWADRLMLELDHSKTALFFTLTYDDEHITPAMFDDSICTWFYTLVKKDLQDFNKRLRFYFEGRVIRFYSVGEYGDKTLRPHFHGIYFGLSFSDFPDKELLGFNVHNQPLYTSDSLRRIWKNGNVSIGNISWQSCAYVARYNLKKLSNDSVLAESRNCLPEFSLMSRKPGIAGYFPIDHPEIFDNPRDKLFISDPYGVKSVSDVDMPSYIFSKLEIVNPDLYAKIKLEKSIASNESFLAELSKTDLDEFDYLRLKESNHERSAKSLVRNLEV